MGWRGFSWRGGRVLPCRDRCGTVYAPAFAATGVLASFGHRATLPSMPHQPRPRRLPAPWRVERIPAGWVVLDATGRNLAYVYGSDERSGVGDDRLTLDEARRVAVNIARMPDLLAPKPA